jgi:hypothetical protein
MDARHPRERQDTGAGLREVERPSLTTNRVIAGRNGQLEEIRPEQACRGVPGLEFRIPRLRMPFLLQPSSTRVILPALSAGLSFVFETWRLGVLLRLSFNAIPQEIAVIGIEHFSMIVLV